MEKLFSVSKIFVCILYKISKFIEIISNLNIKNENHEFVLNQLKTIIVGAREREI